MKYQLKIFSITLIILISTLLLNSVLSLASFEKIYVSSLVSTFEIVGENVKRKIEQSLKFGKPLDKFQGMDMLLDEVIEKNLLISQVAVLDMQHTLLYKKTSENVARTHPKTIPPLNSDAKETYTTLYKGYYYTYLPLLDRRNLAVGYVNLIYSRNVVYDKLAKMATENLKVLWVLMLITSTSLILFLAMLISRPIQKETSSIKKLLTWPLSTMQIGELNKLEFIKNSHNEMPDLIKVGEDETLHDLAKLKTKYDYVNVDKIKNELELLEYNTLLYVESACNAISRIPNIDRLRKDIKEGFERLTVFYKELSELKDNGALSTELMEVIDMVRTKIEYLQYELEPIFVNSFFVDDEAESA